ncbi:MAG: hypothetical protein Q9214_007488, partial [Letrouitia sp. 1 TL-2023]
PTQQSDVILWDELQHRCNFAVSRPSSSSMTQGQLSTSSFAPASRDGGDEEADQKDGEYPLPTSWELLQAAASCCGHNARSFIQKSFDVPSFCISSFVIAALTALPVVTAITPAGMLAAPRRGVATANPSGEFAIYTSTNYSFEDQEATTTWEQLNLRSGDISTWSTDSNISEVVFVGPTNTSILYINATNEEGDGGISLYTADAAHLASATLAASLPAPFSGLKAVATKSGDIHFLVYAPAYPNGTAYNEDLAETPASTARIYTDIYVRHWDTYLTAERNAVFGGVLKRRTGSYSNDSYSPGSYSLAGELTNYVTGKCNATCSESPVQPFGGSGDYDISPDGSQVIFLTKNIDLPLANFTSSQIYWVPFSGS